LKLPKDWLAPRKEYCIAGFGGEFHTYGFDAAVLSLTTLARRARRTRLKQIPGAQCRECNSIMHPDRETLLEHAKLHLAVELATKAIAKT
jgi:hypothetical protein